MTKIYGVGIRGTGQVAREHIAAIKANPHTRVVAVCGRDEDRTRTFVEKHSSGAKIYTDYAKFLEDQTVDIVSECMPNYLHGPEGVAALEADKHLILEKPCGISQEETNRLFQAAQKSNKKTVVSFVLRWHPLVLNLKRLLEQGAFGELYYISADYWHGIKSTFSSYNWIKQRKFAGGAMITGGSHAADIVRHLGGEIDEVFAYSTKKRTDFDYDTSYVAAVRYANGGVGKISASLDGLNFPYQFNIDLLGTEGAARDGRIYAKKLFQNQSDWVHLACDTPNSGTVTHHPFQAEIDNFVDSILNDAPILCTVEEACRSMDVVYAIKESARIGKPVLVKKR